MLLLHTPLTTATKDRTPPLDRSTSTMLLATLLDLETSSSFYTTTTKRTTPRLPSLLLLFAQLDLEDGTAHSLLFRTSTKVLSPSPSRTLESQVIISLILSTTSTMISLPTSLLEMLSSPLQALDLLNSITEETDSLRITLITDMNLLMSITLLLTPTSSTSSIGLSLDELFSEFRATLLLRALFLLELTSPLLLEPPPRLLESVLLLFLE